MAGVRIKPSNSTRVEEISRRYLYTALYEFSRSSKRFQPGTILRRIAISSLLCKYTMIRHIHDLDSRRPVNTLIVLFSGFRSLRTKKCLHLVYDLKKDDSGKQGKHILVEKGIFEVVIIPCNETRDGNDDHKDEELYYSRLIKGIYGVKSGVFHINQRQPVKKSHYLASARCKHNLKHHSPNDKFQWSLTNSTAGFSVPTVDLADSMAAYASITQRAANSSL
jgi:hypothetical protein